MDLVAPAIAGFIQPAVWRAWAVERVEAGDGSRLMGEVAEAGSVSALMEAVAREGGAVDVSGDLVVGFVWLRHEILDEDLDEVMGIAASLSDTYDGSPSCEEIFGLKRRVLGAGAGAYGVVEELFREAREQAWAVWTALDLPDGSS